MKIYPEFHGYRKIPRLSREIIVTEKIDGSNVQIYIDDNNEIFAGSRTKWISPGKNTDNYGFAQWVIDNKEELLKLGEGRYFGEWYGYKINRNYGLPNRKLVLFKNPDVLPSICEVVPTLYVGEFSEQMIYGCLEKLIHTGSCLVPRFMKPEGIVIFHTASGQLFKKTIEDDDGGIT